MNEYIKCDLCNGHGIIIHYGIYKWCFKCKGIGYLTWIENIFGKSEDFVDDSDRAKLERKLYDHQYNQRHSPSILDSYTKVEKYEG